LSKLQQNGFVVTDRLSWDRFLDAYAWIYAKDLPVLVTTDSLLHSVHQSYDSIAIDIEKNILIPKLRDMLFATRSQLITSQGQNQTKELDPLYKDVSTYLSVALELLNGQPGENSADNALYSAAVSANSTQSIGLFGSSRQIDFTLFKPRGHYTLDNTLSQYFRAMNWLAQIDFRFVDFNPLTGKPVLHQSQVTAAAILRDAVNSANQRSNWNQIDQLLKFLVGESDNTTLSDFDRFMTDMHFTGAGDAVRGDGMQMLAALLKNDYGYQRITGQLIQRDTGNFSPEPIPRPISFMLMGQRFTIDAYVLGNLVYDRMMKNGKPIPRALPSTLDVMYALGNDNALTHLTDEIKKYDYQPQLNTLRSEVDTLAPDFWISSVYNRWLGMIRTLDSPTTDAKYPQSMRTNAWADKMLQTQLASWAQLRHDNILYVKQSVTGVAVCSYPKGYVEPYPEFYAALYDYAQSASQVLSGVSNDTNAVANIQKRTLSYFNNVMSTAKQLKTLAEKELVLQSFTEEEDQFLKSVVRNYDGGGCGSPINTWDGWYVSLFYDKDDNPAVIADVHTNPNIDPPLGPASVLHAATGAVVPICLTAETDEGSTLYVGPCFTYYDVIETGYPPVRLTDNEWRSRVSSGQPGHPDWTQSFLVSSGSKNIIKNTPIPTSSVRNGSTGVSLTPAITWVPIPGATGFDFQISTDPSFQDAAKLVDSFTGQNKTVYVPARPLAPATTYFWRVRALIGTAAGDWITSAFTTQR
jgi:hypothetical protein